MFELVHDVNQSGFHCEPKEELKVIFRLIIETLVQVLLGPIIKSQIDLSDMRCGNELVS